MIDFTVIDAAGIQQKISIPEGISLSLMEVLKGSDYPVLATCGGMALCATCQVEVESGLDTLREAADAELEMLDQLPAATPATRLACQIRVDEKIVNAVFRLRGQ